MSVSQLPQRPPARSAATGVSPVRARRTRLRHALRLLLADAADRLRRDGRRRGRLVEGAETLAAHWERTIAAMLQRTPAAAGNDVTALTEGDDFFESMWSDVDRAERQVWVETYILADDRVGRETIARLTAAAARGCSVILIFDAVGSMALRPPFWQPLLDAGGRVCVFNPPRTWWRLRLNPLQRDHRKLVILDGRVAYVGGMNISEDYAGERHGRCTFSDCQLRIEGPAARLLEEGFVRVLRLGDVECCPVGPASAVHSPPGGAPIQEGGAIVQILESAGRTGRRHIQRELRTVIRASCGTLDIATPYFVPPQGLLDSLRGAARRGVAVRLLTAGCSDVPTVTRAARHIYDRLLKRGVRIYEADRPILHAKAMIADRIYATVGSFNLDYWSDKRNLELKVGVVHQPLIETLQAEFDRVLAGATEVTAEVQARRGWRERFVNWLSYHVMRL